MTTLSANLPNLMTTEQGYVKNILQAMRALGAAVLAFNSAQSERQKDRSEYLKTAEMLSRKADAYQSSSPAYAEELRYFSADMLSRAHSFQA